MADKQIMFGTGYLIADEDGRLYVTSAAAGGSGESLDEALATVSGIVHLKVGEQFVPVAEDNTVGVIKHEERYLTARKTSDGLVYTGAGKLHSIQFSPTGTITAGVITVYDNTAESGTALVTQYVPVGAAPFVWTPDVPFATGLYIGFDGSIANVAVQVAYRTSSMA